MRNLFHFLWRNQFFTLFILLELVSILLLSNSFSYQRSLRYHTLTDFSGSVFSSYNSVDQYFGLQKENLRLAQENARLRSQLSAHLFDPDTTTLKADSLFRFIPASVISNSVSRRNNLIIVNKGQKQGVQKEMGVVSPDGVAGIVIGVSNNYAVIMSLLHHNAHISGRVKKNDQLVNVKWDQPDYRFGTITDIPSHLQLEINDSIVTSGNSLIFPKDILIGVVEEHTKMTGEHLGSAVIRFSTDFNSLKQVYLIENFQANELDTLLLQISEQ